MARKPARLISVAELARRQGVSVDTALRRLKRIDARAGGGILLRFSDGQTAGYYTTLTLLAKADPRLLEEQEMLRQDVDDVKEWKLKAHAEIQRLRARVAALERAGNG